MQIAELKMTESSDVAVINCAAESSTPRGPLFVVGMWRSGTSLLYALLNKHPQIALLYEGDLHVLRPLSWVPAPGPWKLRRWEFWNDALERHNLHTRDFSGSDLSQIALDAYRHYADEKGALIGGEKSPNYFDSITRLADDFPDARFMVIWRDPEAICNSVIRAARKIHSWFDRSGMWLRVLLGMEEMRIECNRLAAKYPTRLHELSYEEMVHDPETTMKAICAFLEIPFVPDMASLEGADRSAIYEAGPHEMVRSKQIVSSARRADVVPDKLKKKIACYVSFWRENYRESWPQIQDWKTRGSVPPLLFERLSDRVQYRCLRLLDAAIVLAYCLVPLALLARFRHFQRKREEVRAKQQAKTSSDSSSNAAATTSRSE